MNLRQNVQARVDAFLAGQVEQVENNELIAERDQSLGLPRIASLG